jgi:sugar/nucleoside kinase (ribokinase family)
MAYSICTVGNLTIDDIILYDTRQMFLERCGGDALYAAIGARVWNADTSMICRAGNSFPQAELVKIPGFGIKPCLIRVEYNDIRNWALYEPGGARQFINHISSGMNADLSVWGAEIPDSCLAASGYHVAPMPIRNQVSVIERLYGKGPISFDPYIYSLSNPADRELTYQVLKYVDLFLPSQEEAVALYQSNDIVAAARKFADAGPKVVAIKMSNRGSLLYLKATNEFFQIPIYSCNAVDPTGAGDSYCGGFLTGYLETGDPVTAACYGTVSSSYVIEYVGALTTFDADFSTAPERRKAVLERVTKLSI